MKTCTLDVCHRGRCKKEMKARSRQHYLANKQKYIDRAKAQPTEQKRAARNRWKERNPSKVLAHGRFRKRNIKDRTPPWITEAHYDQMNELYHQAKELSRSTGIPHEVDHIIPLCGKNVSGLHIPLNMRVITRAENGSRPRNFIE